MVRLEAVAKGLYYPTPDRVIAACAAHIATDSPGPRQAHVFLDPCAGEGRALAGLVRAVPGGLTYGVELNEERGEAARALLDHVLIMDAYRVQIGNGKFSCLLLNPPYDSGPEQGGRLEYNFLTAFCRALAPGGLLLYIVPQAILARAARYLATHFHTVRVWRFPDPEFAIFRQVVIVATKRERALPTLGGADRVVAAMAASDLPILPGVPDVDDERWLLAAVPATPPIFRPAFFDPLVARRAVAGTRGAWSAVSDDCWPGPAARAVAPLMPLRRGHVALLLQGGALDGLVLDGMGGRRVVVKGRSVKALDRIETDEQLIERERIATSIVMMDVRTGEFTRVGEGAGRAKEEQTA